MRPPRREGRRTDSNTHTKTRVIANKRLQEAESWFLPMLISFGVLVGMIIMAVIGIWA